MPRSQFFVLIAALVVVSLFSSALTLSLSQEGYFSSAAPVAASDSPTVPATRASARVQAASPNLLDLQSSVQGIAHDVSPSVVSIVMSRDVRVYRGDRYGMARRYQGTVEQKLGGGTGIFVNDQGLILTNKHVVTDTQVRYTVVMDDGREYEGRVVALDPTTDLAVVQAYESGDKKLSGTVPVKFADNPDGLSIGSFVVAVGNALAEFQNTVTFGVVSGLDRTIDAADAGSYSAESVETLAGLIQTDAAINPGNSGGPLLNIDGQVVGINTAVADGATGLGFAIPVSAGEVSHIVDSVIKYGSIKRAFVGVYYTFLESADATAAGSPEEYGYRVEAPESGTAAVVAGSPAAKAGIKEGDILLSVAGKPLDDPFALKNFLKNSFPGDKISFHVYRPSTKETLDIPVTLAEGE
jgi:serine protease Do